MCFKLREEKKRVESHSRRRFVAYKGLVVGFCVSQVERAEKWLVYLKGGLGGGIIRGVSVCFYCRNEGLTKMTTAA